MGVMTRARAHFHLEICASFGNFPIVRSTKFEMTKHEFRMTKESRSSNDEAFERGDCFLASDFVINSAFGIWHSSFLPS